jgi:hypothetical protein
MFFKGRRPHFFRITVCPIFARTNREKEKEKRKIRKKDKENTLLNAFAIVIEAPSAHL